MMPQDVIVEDEAATAAFAHDLAQQLQVGDVVALYGPLGSGKTTLARALIRALTTPDEDVPSPTFTLVQTYDTRRGELWHFDLYRLNDPDEVWELGFEDALTSAICLIEWPERLGPLLPSRAITLHLTPLGETRRRLVLSGATA